MPALRDSARQALATTRTEEDLHLCPDCGSDLVQPIDWAPVDMRRWRVELQCPECESERAGVFTQPVLDRYDAILDDGAASLIDDLGLLERSNLEGEIDRFSAALHRGQILPEDF